MAKTKHLSYWYFIPPIVTFVLLLPIIFELPPFMPKGVENPNTFQTLVVLPFYLGLAAAPGYIYAWLGNYNAQLLDRKRRIWVRGSLLAAIIASLAGGLLSIFTVIVAPFALGSLVVSVKLLFKFQRAT